MGRKKNGYFTVRLTVSVDAQLFVIFFGVLLTLYYDYMIYQMDFTPEKSFSSNYKNSQLLLTAAAALSQRSDSGIAETLKALKMHF